MSNFLYPSTSVKEFCNFITFFIINREVRKNAENIWIQGRNSGIEQEKINLGEINKFNTNLNLVSVVE